MNCEWVNYYYLVKFIVGGAALGIGVAIVLILLFMDRKNNK